MTHRAICTLPWLAMGVALGAFACGGSAQLAPAPNAEFAGNSSDVAVARSAGGVMLAARADAWPGSPRVSQKLTPIQIQIENRSPTPVRASLSDIRLVTPGESMVAREPDSIDIEPQATTVGKTAADFDSRTGSYEYAPPHSAKSLLAREIRSLSLPEGPIASGERVQGFIYFDALPGGARAATLQVAVRHDAAGPIDTVLTIPFERD